jgi:hypothetical protein
MASDNVFSKNASKDARVDSFTRCESRLHPALLANLRITGEVILCKGDFLEKDTCLFGSVSIGFALLREELFASTDFSGNGIERFV